LLLIVTFRKEIISMKPILPKKLFSCMVDVPTTGQAAIREEDGQIFIRYRCYYRGSLCWSKWTKCDALPTDILEELDPSKARLPKKEEAAAELTRVS
jgi:hypothetical protein